MLRLQRFHRRSEVVVFTAAEALRRSASGLHVHNSAVRADSSRHLPVGSTQEVVVTFASTSEPVGGNFHARPRCSSIGP